MKKQLRENLKNTLNNFVHKDLTITDDIATVAIKNGSDNTYHKFIIEVYQDKEDGYVIIYLGGDNSYVESQPLDGWLDGFDTLYQELLDYEYVTKPLKKR